MEQALRNDRVALSVTEAAELLGVSRPTMYQLIRQEGFPSFRIGARRLISRSGLEEWVRGQTENGGGAV